MSKSLVIVAASARAAAHSARRAGFSPRCADLFADVDLRAIAPVSRICQYPAAVPDAVDGWRGAALIYGGAMENHPEIVDLLSESFALLGNRGEVLRGVRDPQHRHRALAGAGLAAPAVAASGDDLPRNGTWLVKPLRGSAGVGVRPWLGGDGGGRDCYFQQRVDGVSSSAMFVAAGGHARLLGTTSQWVGKPWTGAGSFQYCGSIGPLRLDSAMLAQWQRIGSCLAGAFDLVGLFGVDAVLSQGMVWPVEVNPRYTASVEILERGTATDFIRFHVDACLDGALPVESNLAISDCCGKAILFARRDLTIAPKLTAAAVEANRSSTWPTFADIPQPGQFIRQCRPVMTVLAGSHDPLGVEQQLIELARRVEGWLDG